MGGTITANAVVASVGTTALAAVMADPSAWPRYATPRWTQWMNTTAVANSAPSWSRGRTANPGCTMAPWGDSVSGSTVQISGDTIIDARDSGCATVVVQQMTVKLAGDLTIFAPGFETISGAKCQSSDGETHTVTVVVPGATACSSPNSVKLSAGTTTDELTNVNIQAAGKITVDGPTAVRGRVVAGCFAASGSVTLDGR